MVGRRGFASWQQRGLRSRRSQPVIPHGMVSFVPLVTAHYQLYNSTDVGMGWLSALHAKADSSVAI